MSQEFALDFISREDLLRHVKDTVSKYRFQINLRDFNKNLIDPVKFSFDAAVYGKTVEEMIETEIVRQIDKSNTNHIGYFHQNIFKYIGEGWEVPERGFDVVNRHRKLFVKIKNTDFTMNTSLARCTYIRMQNAILQDREATCLSVDDSATSSLNKKWVAQVYRGCLSSGKIRRLSMDKFYEIATGDKNAFIKLWLMLPSLLAEALNDLNERRVYVFESDQLKFHFPDLLKNVYLRIFKKYEGFNCNLVGSGFFRLQGLDNDNCC